MQFLRNLFGPTDPTRAWPRHLEVSIPLLDLSRPAFGSMVFGDPLDAAEFLGRPTKINIQPRTMDLYYPGFKLEFEDGQFILCQVEFKDNSGKPTGHVLRLTNGTVITGDSTHQDIVSRFGDQFDPGQWEKCDVMQYILGKMVFEAFFDDDHQTLLYATAYLN